MNNTIENQKDLKKAAVDGYIPAMYEYGMETNDIDEKRLYLNMAKANGCDPTI